MKTLLALSLLFYGFTPSVSCDMNRDGRISTTDIVMIRRGASCDVNLDGVKNENDVYFLRYYLANSKGSDE